MSRTIDTTAAVRFLTALFAPGDTILFRPIETWTQGDKKHSQVDHKGIQYSCVGLRDRTGQQMPEHMERMVGSMHQRSEQTRANVFFGTCPRFGTQGRFDLGWQIRAVRVLWADIDHCTVEEVLQRCQAAGLPDPSVVVNSGHGVHLYWLLAEPYLIDDVGAPPQVQIEWVEIKGKKRPIHYFADPHGERVYLEDRATGKSIPANRPPLSPKALLVQDVLKGIAAKIGGDHTTDLSRLLRLPGTWNRKDERNGRAPVLCEMVHQSDARYAFAEFKALAEASEDRQRREKVAQVRLPKPRKPSASKQGRLDVLINRSAAAPAGQRSEADFALCCYAIEKGIDRAEVWSQVSGIGKFAERGEEYFSRTWENAQEHARERIYTRAARSNRNPTEIKPLLSGTVVSTEATLEPAAGVPSLVDAEGRTDLANARRFIAMYRNRLLYCHPWKKWIVWDGMRWKLDDDGSVMRLAKSVADAVWADARELDGLDAAMQHAVRTASDRSVKAILSLAASDVPVVPAQLDSNPWLLNCPNGTLDLRTGELLAHRREDYITKLCPTQYDPDAESFTWDQFLAGVFAGSQPIIEFLQRLCGYAITGDQREQILPILWGDGSNGKSTLLNAILHAVGPDYAMQAAPDLLMAKRGETHPTDKADLFGKRIVSCIETDEGRQLSESFVKMLTGGERVRARRMREDFWEFAATHTVFLATNHKPGVKGDDHAIWRRLALIPFVVTFWNPEKGEAGPVELKQDKTLPAQLEAQAPGILAWAVRGCRDWQAGGLKVPTEVRAATTRYQVEEDKISTFIEENCYVGAQFRVRGGQLYGAYKKWCEVIGEAPMTMTKFGRRIKKRSDITDDRSNGTWYIGIGLRDDREPQN